jgi:hypothetical protein
MIEFKLVKGTLSKEITAILFSFRLTIARPSTLLLLLCINQHHATFPASNILCTFFYLPIRIRRILLSYHH